MTDALSEAYNCEKQAEEYSDFLFLVALYLENPNQDHFHLIIEATKTCDDIPRSCVKDVKGWLKSLQDKDDSIWLKLLLRADGLFCFPALELPLLQEERIPNSQRQL